MKNALIALGILAVCGGPLLAGPFVAGPSVPQAADSQPILGVAGHWTIDHSTGAIINRTGPSRATTIYDNTTNSTLTAFQAGALTDDVGDNIWMRVGALDQGGTLDELSFSIWNSSSSVGPLSSVDVTFDFYDPSLTIFASFIQPLTFDPPLAQGNVQLITITGLSGLSTPIVLPYAFLIAQNYANVVGADLLGQAIYTPPTVGLSGQTFFQLGAFYSFNDPAPAGDFYYAIGVVDPTAQDPVLWDTGGNHIMKATAGTYTNLGYTSGFASVTQPQRWAAIPFSIAQTSFVTDVLCDYFIAAGQECDVVNYIIWKRTALNLPVNGDQYISGLLGPTGNGLTDMRGAVYPSAASPTSGIHEYPFAVPDIVLRAGDYYLTIYGDGGVTPNTIAWFTGGDLQPEALEQPFMWRCQTFPVGGFSAYVVAGYVTWSQMTDGDDFYNPSFMLRGTAVQPGDMNCDGRVDNFDITPFVLALTSTPPDFPEYYAAHPFCDVAIGDINGDGDTNNFDITPFVALLTTP